MGRRAGIRPDQTREQVLQAAARVFAHRGYDRATLSEIAADAGVSTGAIYVHYDGKAELFSEVLRAHVRRELEQRDDGSAFDIADFVADLGANLDRRPPAERRLLVEAVTAARHDDKTREALSRWFSERHEFLAAAVTDAQRAGTLSAAVPPAAAARFVTAVMLGWLLLDNLDVPEVEHDEWAALVVQLVDSLRRES